MHFDTGDAFTRTLGDFDGFEADRPGRTSGSCDGTSGARSGGAGSTTELSSEFFANLDDPVMQQLGSFMQQLQAKNDDLEKRLAASEEKARINQMVRDHEERGVSTFHHDRCQMAHVFEMLVLPHISDRSTRVYYKNLDCRT